jgi:hypothetical protein
MSNKPLVAESLSSYTGLHSLKMHIPVTTPFHAMPLGLCDDIIIRDSGDKKPFAEIPRIAVKLL